MWGLETLVCRYYYLLGFIHIKYNAIFKTFRLILCNCIFTFNNIKHKCKSKLRGPIFKTLKSSKSLDQSLKKSLIITN